MTHKCISCENGEIDQDAHAYVMVGYADEDLATQHGLTEEGPGFSGYLCNDHVCMIESDGAVFRKYRELEETR